MVLPQLMAFVMTCGVLTIAAIGLIQYLNQPEQPFSYSANSRRTANSSQSEWSGYDSQGEENVCTICLDAIQVTKRLTLPCKHSFHVDCLNQWVSNGVQKCPNCRKQI